VGQGLQQVTNKEKKRIKNKTKKYMGIETYRSPRFFCRGKKKNMGRGTVNRPVTIGFSERAGISHDQQAIEEESRPEGKRHEYGKPLESEVAMHLDRDGKKGKKKYFRLLT